MNAVTYLCIQAELADFAFRLRHLPLDEFIAAGEKADMLGPVFDPSLYRAASARLADALLLARAAKEFCRACEKMSEDWLIQLARSLDDAAAPPKDRLIELARSRDEATAPPTLLPAEKPTTP